MPYKTATPVFRLVRQKIRSFGPECLKTNTVNRDVLVLQQRFEVCQNIGSTITHVWENVPIVDEDDADIYKE